MEKSSPADALMNILEESEMQHRKGFSTVSLALPSDRGRHHGAIRPMLGNEVFELGVVATESRLRLSPLKLAIERPVALLAMVPRGLVLFGAGAMSGAIAKTITAPLDRTKILLQVKGGLQTGAVSKAAAEGNLIKSLIAIGKQEGLTGYWKGNLAQVRGGMNSSRMCSMCLSA
jgi:hypothetical protein